MAPKPARKSSPTAGGTISVALLRFYQNYYGDGVETEDNRDEDGYDADVSSVGSDGSNGSEPTDVETKENELTDADNSGGGDKTKDVDKENDEDECKIKTLTCIDNKVKSLIPDKQNGVLYVLYHNLKMIKINMITGVILDTYSLMEKTKVSPEISEILINMGRDNYISHYDANTNEIWWICSWQSSHVFRFNLTTRNLEYLESNTKNIINNLTNDGHLIKINDKLYLLSADGKAVKVFELDLNKKKIKDVSENIKWKAKSENTGYFPSITTNNDNSLLICGNINNKWGIHVVKNIKSQSGFETLEMPSIIRNFVFKIKKKPVLCLTPDGDIVVMMQPRNVTGVTGNVLQPDILLIDHKNWTVNKFDYPLINGSFNGYTDCIKILYNHPYKHGEFSMFVDWTTGVGTFGNLSIGTINVARYYPDDIVQSLKKEYELLYDGYIRRNWDEVNNNNNLWVPQYLKMLMIYFYSNIHKVHKLVDKRKQNER